MQIKSENTIAVISGDIIDSTKLSHQQYDQLLDTLGSTLKWIESQHPLNITEISRGDAFQVVICDLTLALKYALLIRIALRSLHDAFDCRICVGIGSNNQIRTSLGMSTGEAFTLSGRGLNQIGSQQLEILATNEKFTQDFALLTKYVDGQLKDLTQRQSAILKLQLLGEKNLTQGEIASRLNANRVSINRSIKSAQLGLIEEYWQLFANKIQEFYG